MYRTIAQLWPLFLENLVSRHYLVSFFNNLDSCVYFASDNSQP